MFAAHQPAHPSLSTTLSVSSLLFGEAASIGRARESANGRFAGLAIAA